MQAQQSSDAFQSDNLSVVNRFHSLFDSPSKAGLLDKLDVDLGSVSFLFHKTTRGVLPYALPN